MTRPASRSKYVAGSNAASSRGETVRSVALLQGRNLAYDHTDLLGIHIRRLRHPSRRLPHRLCHHSSALWCGLIPAHQARESLHQAVPTPQASQAHWGSPMQACARYQSSYDGMHRAGSRGSARIASAISPTRCRRRRHQQVLPLLPFLDPLRSPLRFPTVVPARAKSFSNDYCRPTFAEVSNRRHGMRLIWPNRPGS